MLRVLVRRFGGLRERVVGLVSFLCGSFGKLHFGFLLRNGWLGWRIRILVRRLTVKLAVLVDLVNSVVELLSCVLLGNHRRPYT